MIGAALGGLGLLCMLAGAASAVEGHRSDLVNRKVLRVCADPANLPFSNEKKEGFENKIADIIGNELGVPVEYTWFPQATGFTRNTLLAKRCDVIIGTGQGDDLVLNTNALYRSAYALIYKAGGEPRRRRQHFRSQAEGQVASASCKARPRPISSPRPD